MSINLHFVLLRRNIAGQVGIGGLSDRGLLVHLQAKVLRISQRWSSVRPVIPSTARRTSTEALGRQLPRIVAQSSWCRVVLAKVGTPVTLSATGTSDPDGNKAKYTWWYYEEAASAISKPVKPEDVIGERGEDELSVQPKVKIENSEGKKQRWYLNQRALHKLFLPWKMMENQV